MRSALLLALAALLLPSALAQVPPLPESPAVEVKGDWVVTGTETRTDAELFVHGNITVKDGGTLELRHTKLVMGQPQGEQKNPLIEVRPGGTLRLLATEAGGSAITSNETWVRWRMNGTFVSQGGEGARNLIEWVWGEIALDDRNKELVPALPDGGSASGFRIDGGGTATLARTDVRMAAVRHFIVSRASLILEDVVLGGNDPDKTAVRVPLQAVVAAKGAKVTLRDVRVEPVHTGLYVIDADSVLIERSTIEGGVPLGHSGTSPVALQMKKGTATVRGSTLRAPGTVVSLESTATFTAEDSALAGYTSIGLAAVGIRAGTALAGSPTITLRNVDFQPAGASTTQVGVQTVFGGVLTVENSRLVGHTGSGIAAVNTTVRLLGNTLHRNGEWGAWLHGGVLVQESGNDYGSGATANRLGRVLKDLLLYVRVVDGNSDPVSNATVRALDKDGREVWSSLTRGPNPRDPKGAEKEGWVQDAGHLIAFQVANDGTRQELVPYTLEASKKGFPTKSAVLDDLRWQRIGIVLAGASGEAEPIVGGEVVDNPFEEKSGFVDGGDHGDEKNVFEKIPGLEASGLLAALLLALLRRRR